MALSTATVWEVRPTVGSDSNGGGFVAGASGTDFSQQNSAQYSASDLAVDGSVNTKVTSASHNFVSSDVGNLINISTGSGGWTAGFYQIVSVASNAATLDRSPAATSTTGGSYAVGGALATVSKAYTAAALSNTIYVKASGTYTVTTSLTLTGTNTTPFLFIGYTSTRSDGGKATWTTATNSTSLVKFGSPGSNFIFQNFTFTNTAGTRATGFDGGLTGQSSALRLSNCICDGFSVAIGLGYVNAVHFNLTGLVMDSCEVKNCTSHGVSCSPGTLIVACRIHDNLGDGVHGSVVASGTGATNAICLERCALWNNTGDGVFNELGTIGSGTMSYLQITNSAIGANGSNGIEIDGAVGFNYQMLVVINTVIESNGAFGIKNNSSTGIGLPLLLNNAFRNNTSGNYSGTGLAAQSSDVTLTAEPFTNPGSGDFTLNNTAGGGAALKAVAFPSALP